ncbi:hypothetical protein [Umezawaea tangerina]|uniref:Uncharacterized protein n=1 Tax=Umezawaea tangerina TaxID=84725 RepID=A0A2T0SG88_9PSEU|nr:hypothetical protein [Umezawaea tangerina]PRY32430.1 hypothetical protein CLV43_12124 [Umezawaea tangerina]
MAASHGVGRTDHFLDDVFDLVDWYPWDHGTPHTRSFDGWTGCDLLLSFKADFVIPDRMLSGVRGHAVNVHPSVPRYRGIGGYRVATAVSQGRELVPDDRERWGRRLYTRADLAAYRDDRLAGVRK